MTPLLMVDGTHPFDHQALHDAGVRVVARYIGPFRKAASRAELAGYRAAGFGVVLIWERGELDATKGERHGRLEGQLARAHAERLDLPAAPVVATVDHSVDPASTLPYGRGFAATCSSIGVYGSAGVIDAWRAAGLIPAGGGWQANARGWDSPRRWSVDASIRQHLPTSTGALGSRDPSDVDAGSPLVTWPANPQELTVADIQTILDRLQAVEATQAAQGKQLGTVAGQVEQLHADYCVSREPTGRTGDNGSKRWQIGRTLVLVRELLQNAERG